MNWSFDQNKFFSQLLPIIWPFCKVSFSFAGFFPILTKPIDHSPFFDRINQKSACFTLTQRTGCQHLACFASNIHDLNSTAILTSFLFCVFTESMQFLLAKSVKTKSKIISNLIDDR